jgi:hypothetical protein
MKVNRNKIRFADFIFFFTVLAVLAQMSAQ